MTLTRNCQNYTYTLNTYPEASLFQDTRLSTELEHLTVRSTLYTLNTYPRGPNFHPFTLRPAVSTYKIVQNWKCTEWPQTNLEHLWSEVPCINWILTLRPKFSPAVFEIHGSCRKSEMHRMTSDGPWTLNCQKYPVYIEYLPLRTKLHSVSLYDGSFFQLIRVFTFHICYNG